LATGRGTGDVRNPASRRAANQNRLRRRGNHGIAGAPAFHRHTALPELVGECRRRLPRRRCRQQSDHQFVACPAGQFRHLAVDGLHLQGPKNGDAPGRPGAWRALRARRRCSPNRVTSASMPS
jgi:hypothetical protein